MSLGIPRGSSAQIQSAFAILALLAHPICVDVGVDVPLDGMRIGNRL